jgi:hypothetical protein
MEYLDSNTFHMFIVLLPSVSSCQCLQGLAETNPWIILSRVLSIKSHE